MGDLDLAAGVDRGTQQPEVVEAKLSWSIGTLLPGW